jgi:hypothetical protein
MYKLPVIFNDEPIKCVITDGGLKSIPFDPANSDFIKFKKEIQGIGEMGASITPVELQDADGNTMTSEEVAEFITTLP